MKIDEKLRKQMLDKGFNQQKLARASGVSDSEVSRILGGKSQPGLENALRLARALGVSLDYLADQALDHEAGAPRDAGGSIEAEILESARSLGVRHARRILETAADLGYEVAIRRLLEIKPLIEVGEPPRVAPIPTIMPDRRASTG